MNRIKTATSSKRILAIDILRGITIAGMTMVNNPGSWGHIYAPLRHAQWNGLTPTDLVFPFFMFIMGISTYISLKKYDFTFSRAAALKIIRRTAVIFLIGLGLAWFGSFCFYWASPTEGIGFWAQLGESVWTFDHIRILGVDAIKIHRVALYLEAAAVISSERNIFDHFHLLDVFLHLPEMGHHVIDRLLTGVCRVIRRILCLLRRIIHRPLDILCSRFIIP